jgi:predicted ATPase/signal transduction histidine kinase
MSTSERYHVQEVISEEARVTLCRGVRREDGKPVLLKLLREAYPALEDIARLQHEYTLTQRLRMEGVLQVEALERFGSSLALVLEGFEGESLRTVLQRRRPGLEQGLRLGLQLAETLGQLHRERFIHKSLQPANILLDRSGARSRITNFALASQLSRESTPVNAPGLFGDALAYLSPEQTGRMNRSVDYRTDFYSLGVILYELLTGEPPFVSSEPLELVHAHIARQPVPPHQREPGVPRAVSDIVLKLLAKTAEERYQSAFGLKADLEQCLAGLGEPARLEGFRPGQGERPAQLQVAQTLYGRDPELARLHAAFERASGGTSELVLVAGYSGIGKSSLIQEVHKPVVQRRGYFISGKFDQLKRDVPFASLVQAFQELIRQLLTESDTRIQRWRERLLETLGTGGQVLIDVIPEIEIILGPQPAVPRLVPTEAQQRFHLLLRRFVSAFASAEHPLVIFLDDLQWADTASLRFIRQMMTDAESQFLLLIGAYRDNEVDASHPLQLTLAELEKAGARFEQLTLAPLLRAHVEQWMADTLRCAPEHSRPLADAIFTKTGGNPFFVTQLLQELEDEGLLRYDFAAGQWRWALDAIQQRGISDNVVDLMVRKIRRLPERTQHALRLAACVGSRFELQPLAAVCRGSLHATASQLWEAIHAGLVLPLSDAYAIPMALDPGGLDFDEATLAALPITYRFLHDRVQQAAYDLTPAEDRAKVHLEIGRMLLASTSPEAQVECLFDIVNNLNKGAELITEPAERQRLADLNLKAGRKAKDSTAHGAAVAYLSRGLAILGPDGWREHYTLALELHVEAMEAEFLVSNLPRARELAATVLAQARTLLDTLKVNELRIQFHISQGQMAAAIETALEVLGELGVTPRSRSDDPKASIERLWGLLAAQGRQIEDLAALPEMRDPSKLAAMRILMNLSAPAFIAEPPLWQKVILTMVDLCVEHGNSPVSGFAYVYTGNLLCGALGDMDSGYRMGRMALELLERYDARSLKVKANVPYNLTIRHWKEHLRGTIESFHEAIHQAVELGDFEFASFNATNYCSAPFLVGESLEGVEQLQRRYVLFTRRRNQAWHEEYISIWHQVTLNLLGRAEDRLRLKGEGFNEDEALPRMVAQNNTVSAFAAYHLKCQLSYLLGDSAGAVRWARHAEQFTAGALGFYTQPVHVFYFSLALLAEATHAPPETRAALLEQVELNQRKLADWARHAPMNYQHKHELVAAELARLEGRWTEAMAGYDNAIQGASQHGYLQEEAIARELAAELYLQLGRREIHDLYLRGAHHCYLRWGAVAKVEALEARYPRQLRGAGRQDVAREPTSPRDSQGLDLAAVLKTSRALTREIVLDKLLAVVMQTVLATAGAQRGMLLLKTGSEWTIAAEGRGDGHVEVAQGHPVALEAGGEPRLPAAIVNYVARSREDVVLDDAARGGLYTRDPYILATQPRSVLCTPLQHRGTLSAILYLENNLTTGAFTPERVGVLRILSSQAAISIENARLYEKQEEYSRTLEARVEERTRELQEKNGQLASALAALRETQAQIVAQEKLASLGALTAGIAHEIKNPLNFVINFARIARELAADITTQLQPRGQLGSDLSDLGEAVKEVEHHGQRADKIVRDMLLLSRGERGERRPTHINRLLEDSAQLVYRGLKGNDPTFMLSLVTDFDESLEPLEVFPSELSRAFVNIIQNACYAVNAKSKARSEGTFQPTLRLSTSRAGDRVKIDIRDNGVGIPRHARDKVFTPFFTTKPPNEGTGLGLAISHDILVAAHRGRIEIQSEEGEYTNVSILLPRS